MAEAVDVDVLVVPTVLVAVESTILTRLTIPGPNIEGEKYKGKRKQKAPLGTATSGAV